MEFLNNFLVFLSFFCSLTLSLSFYLSLSLSLCVSSPHGLADARVTMTTGLHDNYSPGSTSSFIRDSGASWNLLLDFSAQTANEPLRSFWRPQRWGSKRKEGAWERGKEERRLGGLELSTSSVLGTQRPTASERRLQTLEVSLLPS